jgi:dipeptidyl aminopeptidase/acylaminoacyl peptidase
MKKLFSLLGLFISLMSFGQNKVLDHSVYDGWQSIREVVYQPQGKFVSYVIAPQEGDGILVINNRSNNSEIRIQRGALAQFTEDGRFLIAKIKPLFQETRKAKIDKKKPDEMPKDSMVIVNLASGSIEKIASVKSFQLPTKGNDQLVYLKDKKGDLNKEGSELVWMDLNSKISKTFNNIAQYQINPIGLGLAMYQVKTKTSQNKVLLANLVDTIPMAISSNFYTVTGLSWDDNGKSLAYLIENDSTDKALQKNYSLAFYKAGDDSAKRLVTRTNPTLPINYTIGGEKRLKFSKSGNVLELGIQPILPVKDTSLPEFERAVLDIWHYNDAALQSVQVKNLEADLKATEPVLYHVNNDKFVYLGKIKDRNIISTEEGDGAISYVIQDSTYEIASQWQGYSLKDIYQINNQNGQRSLVQKGWKGNLISSAYDGSYLLFYDEVLKKYFAYDHKTQKKTVVAKDIKFPLYDEDNDVPDDPNAYGIAKWLNDNESFILYDRYDLWLVDAKGIKPSIALTNGRISKTVYRFIETDVERKTFSNTDSLLIKGFSEIDKSESIAMLTMHNKQLSVLNKVPMHFTGIEKAKLSSDFTVLQEDEKTSPNLFPYQFTATVQNPKPITNINEQQKEYNWLTTELVTWKAYTGKKAEGIMYYPEDFNPKKKYPMIVYFYERNNQTLHNYLAPAPTPSRLNIPFFVSRGYLVFVPDIWYQKGYPGQGAYDYILSGTRAMVQKGYVDSTKIGLQGQSWGGYQIAYLINKTNLYAAAWAGAPVVNMTSAYGGIRWGPGIVRQFQYEKTQSRIGATLWERPDLYIQNSPLFSLPKVTTPLVIMSNDADDAVPWYQGIEYFTAMRRLNKKIWMLVYNNEAHNLVERKNRKDIQIREQQFFDHYLKGEPMPTWMSNGLPAIMKGRDWGLH